MQEAASRRIGLETFYLVLEVDRRAFSRIMRSKSRLPFAGYNVTVPYKEAVIPFLDRVSPEAKAMGAVNTVVNRRGRWLGTNTDVDGFLCSLKKDAGFRTRGCRALVLGAGGSARAVIFGLAREGASQVLIANRGAKRARRLAGEFQRRYPKTVIKVVSQSEREMPGAVEVSSLIVNATSVGLRTEDRSLIPAGQIPRARGARQKKLFYDLVYRPADTDFLRIARRKGHRAVGGLGMLLYQGALAFEFWTGRRAPVKVMRRALAEALKREKT